MSPGIATPAASKRPLGAAGYVDCRVCGSRLFYKRQVGRYTDDTATGVCAECHDRPEAQHLLSPGTRGNGAANAMSSKPGAAVSLSAPAAAPPPKPRAFNAAEKALIRNVHGYMPAAQLLDILNTRLIADVGAAAVPFALEQLETEVRLILPATADDWGGLRDILERARRCGLLAEITPQLVDDFAVIWRLSPAQHMHVRDVVRSAQEQR